MDSMLVTVTETASRELTINFAQSLSAYAPLPGLRCGMGHKLYPLLRVEWSDERDTAIIRTASVGWTGRLENEVRVLDPFFVVDSIQRYEPSHYLPLFPIIPTTIRQNFSHHLISRWKRIVNK